MGTVSPPQASVAKSVVVQAGLFSDRMQSFWPVSKPRALSPRARCLTLAPNSADEMGV